MVVQHNLTAMNSNRMLNVTTKSQAKSTEKLSSGYKINRAADDAAGLSISEKMRKQIRGLTQASSNAQDGISCVQTAEGALTEVHDMLQRMNELAVKSANGTNSQDDRDYIQAEVDQLISEIDRVSTTTKFNETYLLNGDSSAGTKQVRTYTYDSFAATPAEWDVSGNNLYVATTSNSGTAGDFTQVTSDNASTYYEEDGTLKTGLYAFSAADSDATTGADTVSFTEAVAAGTYQAYDSDGTAVAAKDMYDSTGAFITAETFYSDSDHTVTIADGDAVTNVTSATVNEDLTLNLHVGADSSTDNKISFNIAQMSSAGIGVGGLKVDTEDLATAAIETIKSAIQTVSKQRSGLGAIQNRLEHTINNLDNVVENTTSAESSIRDTDMATEMVKYSNNNILSQAGQAMLAQANQTNQGVLSLLG